MLAPYKTFASCRSNFVSTSKLSIDETSHVVQLLTISLTCIKYLLADNAPITVYLK